WISRTFFRRFDRRAGSGPAWSPHPRARTRSASAWRQTRVATSSSLALRNGLSWTSLNISAARGRARPALPRIAPVCRLFAHGERQKESRNGEITLFSPQHEIAARFMAARNFRAYVRSTKTSCACAPDRRPHAQLGKLRAEGEFDAQTCENAGDGGG